MFYYPNTLGTWREGTILFTLVTHLIVNLSSRKIIWNISSEFRSKLILQILSRNKMESVFSRLDKNRTISNYNRSRLSQNNDSERYFNFVKTYLE